MRHLTAFGFGIALSLLLSCGGGNGGGSTQAPAVGVSISPTSATLFTGATQRFTATVTNAGNTNVTWSVQEGNGGSVDTAGYYTAPATVPGGTSTFHVVATSAADPSRSAAAQVTVTQPPDGTVILSPTSATLNYAGQANFTAKVQGSNAGVDWAVQESLPPNVVALNTPTSTTVGFVWFDTSGTQSSDTWHLVATSKADPSKTAIATITLNHPVQVMVGPGNASLLPGGTQSFVAAVYHTPNTAVTWSVKEGPSGGSITPGGVYTAPQGLGTFHVVATSVADPTASGQAEVVVHDNSGGTWTNAGFLGIVRAGFTPVLLNSGKILVAGGYQNQPLAYLQSAEVYDPSTGTSTPVGNLPEPRVRYAAALLPNGKVLIAGGGTGSTYGLKTALLFDPASGTFAPTGSMSTGRYVPLTAVLSDGRVLVVGGMDPNRFFLSSAELYDPGSGTFSSVGPMPSRHMWGTATTLADGRVLVAGGHDNNIPSNTAAVFSPSTLAFSPVSGTLAQAKYMQGATRMGDGRVLIVGGQNGGNLNDPSSYMNSVDIYDPATNSLSPGPSCAVARDSPFLITLKDGRALLAGGETVTGYTATCQVFNPVTNTWSTAAPLNLARECTGAAVLLGDGRVVVLGDRSAVGIASAVEIYTP